MIVNDLHLTVRVNFFVITCERILSNSYICAYRFNMITDEQNQKFYFPLKLNERKRFFQSLF